MLSSLGAFARRMLRIVKKTRLTKAWPSKRSSSNGTVGWRTVGGTSKWIIPSESQSPTKSGASPRLVLGIDICQCPREFRKGELEAFVQESFWHASAASQSQHGLGLHEKSPNVDGERGRWRAPRTMQRPAQVGHEFGVGGRSRRGRVVNAFDVRPLNGPAEHGVHVAPMNPTDVLAPTRYAPTEKTAHEFLQSGERA